MSICGDARDQSDTGIHIAMHTYSFLTSRSSSLGSISTAQSPLASLSVRSAAQWVYFSAVMCCVV